eukprot:g1642.t1
MATPTAAKEYSEKLHRALKEQFLDGSDAEGEDLIDETNESFMVDISHSPGGLGLENLETELDRFREHEVVKGILDQGCDLQSYAKEVEEKLRRVELDSIQDYIQESDNLASLHNQIHDCDRILATMEDMLGKFQTDLSQVSEEIRQLQNQSQVMSVKLKNRRAAENVLGDFVDQIAVPSEMINSVLDDEVNDDYLEYLLTLNHKLKFIHGDEMALSSAAYHDVEPVIEKLRLKAVSKVRDFLLQKIYQLRRPRTNIQIIQQNVLLKFKYFVTFLKEHGEDVYKEVRGEYSKTLSRVLPQHFKSYLSDIERMYQSIATKHDVLGSQKEDTGSHGGAISALFGSSSGGSSSGTPKTQRTTKISAFELGDRLQVLYNLEKAAIVPHVAEYEGKKFPYEVIFRNVHKLLMDTATTEYLFCCDFFNESEIFKELFQPIIAVVEGEFTSIMQDMHDVISLLLMIRINHEHRRIMTRRRVPCLDDYLDRINLLLWPKFKTVFDTQLESIKKGNERLLFSHSPTVHAVSRRFSSMVSSLLVLTAGYEEGDEGAFNVSGFDHMLERLRTAFCSLLSRISRLFKDKRSSIVFLVTNYSHVVSVLREASHSQVTAPSSPGTSLAGAISLGRLGNLAIKEYEEHLLTCTNNYVEDQLDQHFRDLIGFLRMAETAQKQHSISEGSVIPGYGPEQAAPILQDFSTRWTASIEAMNKEVTMQFSGSSCGMDVLQASMTQLLLYYTRLLELVKKQGSEGNAVVRDAVNIPSIMYQIKKYTNC